MPHYVLMFRQSDPHQEDLDRIAKAPGVTIVDHSLRRAMLVDASEDDIAALRASLENWVVAEEVQYGLPGPATHNVDDPHEG